VDRLMRQEGMRGLARGRKVRTTIPARNGQRARDLLNRQFRTSAPNRAWVTDSTYCPTWSRVRLHRLRDRPVLAGDRRLAGLHDQGRRVCRILPGHGALAA
jgi:transposase InsO family protein